MTLKLSKPLAHYSLTIELAKYNEQRLLPGITVDQHPREIEYIEHLRTTLVNEGIYQEHYDSYEFPVDAYEALLTEGPGQNDTLFNFLAEKASKPQMFWFLSQEAAGEAGFEDLLAMTQVGMPLPAKLEMARNYWDEMGNGKAAIMHGPLLSRVVSDLGLAPTIETTVPEALQLANVMTALACHRRYAWLSIGALGVIEMTAPGRVSKVDQGLARLGISKSTRQYFTVHATLDIAHSREWNKHILRTVPEEVLPQLYEGAWLRLWAGFQCFGRYRREFQI